ncbi:related to TRS23-TRAPP subunit involved in targeting and fusion of ER to golgi transport vesicles [Rhynchosporium agropyri]|uniref:Trafficking protein particle complex subunit n=1 Tax=Rhynchosporium agropyri TaxID=914238 RepID=A0A1E1L9M5_9HELO|nr:related to TRS23-TRAPP subunit involved in targeting and fusion of ER to golgi transport vesicles [Rhynchosporium agropyri]
MPRQAQGQTIWGTLPSQPALSITDRKIAFTAAPSFAPTSPASSISSQRQNSGLRGLDKKIVSSYPDTTATMVVFALIIINKAGGLIFQRDFAEGLNKLNINDYLVLAGTFHGVHAITTRLYPLHPPADPAIRPQPPSGIEVLETENFRLQCFQTLTGIKFLLFTEPQQPNIDKVMGKVYELYADYVMKNPFYQLEMPIRCVEWERRLGVVVRGLNSR